jgi:hypothetical protein
MKTTNLKGDIFGGLTAGTVAKNGSIDSALGIIILTFFVKKPRFIPDVLPEKYLFSSIDGCTVWLSKYSRKASTKY